jgi:hypothetical protein
VSYHQFIKLSVVVRDALHPLKGAPLATFLALAVNEAEMSLGSSHGLPAHDLAGQTGYGLRTTHYALEFLCRHHYVAKLEAGGERGESLYRVLALAWFGNPPPRPRCAARSQAPGLPRVSDRRFIKLSVVVRDSLHPLKGARLSTFLALAVNEAEMSLGSPHGLPVPAIADQTGYGLRATRYALAYLCEHGFATKLEARGERDASLYRVSAFAWFGNPPPDGTRNTARKCTLVGKCQGVHSSAPVVVINTRSISNSGEDKQQQAHSTASRAIFAAVAVGGPPLEKLARTVASELARAWTERLAYAPESFRDPVGYMIAHLSHDPTEPPPAAWQPPKQKTWYGDEFAKFVHGRPEHVQYCREHPDAVDCDCGV